MTQIFEREDAQMESTYTEVQLNIFRDRYAHGEEQFPHQAWQRVSSAVAEHEKTEALREEWSGRFRDLLDGFKYLPGGRITAAMGTSAGVTAQNCYVIPSPEDSRQGIMKSLNEWVEIQSRGGGVGVNMSSLRPRGDAVKGVNGTSSGPVNWAQPFAFISKTVIIQGGSRRGAAMIMLDCDHPDVFEFIHAKETSGVLEGCNVSVCISDAFMDAVKNDGPWDLQFGGRVYRTIQARELWDEICEAAWRSAEPGIYFMERANRESNSGYFETLISTNPCGEQPLGAYGACLLGSFNLDSFMVEDGNGKWSFDFDSFRSYIPAAVRFNDNVVDLSHYPLDECRDSQQNIRRMGIGVMGLADCMLRMEMRYGSDESVTFTEDVFRTLRDESYRASVELARERGPFPKYTPEYLERAFIQRLPRDIRDGIARYGIRNCYLLTQAPTGTTSLVAGVNSGIEPYFDFSYLRSDRTGDYTVSSRWAELYEQADRPEWLVASNDVSPEDHVHVQAAAQRYNDSSISKTANAPSSHTVEDVKRLYMLAYDQDLKSISYYRDGSREEQVLYHAGSKVEEAPVDAADAIKAAQELLLKARVPVRRKPPTDRQSITHKFRVGEQEGYMTVGMFEDGSPAELFLNVNRQGSTVSGLMDTVAMLTSYALQYGVPISVLANKFKGTRFDPSGPTGNPQLPIATSIVDYIFRWLELKFSDDAATQPTLIPAEQIANATATSAREHSVASGVGCPDCGDVLFYGEGCLQCRNCGYNKCG